MIIRMSRITNRGRLRRDYSAGAASHYRRVRAEWELTQAEQQERRTEMGGTDALARLFTVVQPATTEPPEDPCPT